MQAPGSVIWNDAFTGDVDLRTSGFGLTCVTIKEGEKAGEQNCHINTAWWDSNSGIAPAVGSSSMDEAIRTTSIATITTTKLSRTLAFSFLRGNDRARDVVSPNGDTQKQTRVVDPDTDLAADDCQATETGRNCTYVNGRWAHVATTDEGATHVTAPGVEVRTAPKEGGDVSVDAWGFHINCRKDPATNKTKCHTTNDWFGSGAEARGGEGRRRLFPQWTRPRPPAGEDMIPRQTLSCTCTLILLTRRRWRQSKWRQALPAAAAALLTETTTVGLLRLCALPSTLFPPYRRHRLRPLTW